MVIDLDMGKWQVHNKLIEWVEEDPEKGRKGSDLVVGFLDPEVGVMSLTSIVLVVLYTVQIS